MPGIDFTGDPDRLELLLPWSHHLPAVCYMNQIILPLLFQKCRCLQFTAYEKAMKENKDVNGFASTMTSSLQAE